MTLDQLVEEVKALTPDEQRRLRSLLDTWLATPPSGPTEEELDRRLLEKGLISRIPPPITDLTPFRNLKPARILHGKPISETIIEERR